MKSAQIREAFFRFFEQNGHTQVASSSLIPANDPTLLFTNAGMNQFKDCFLGLEKRAYQRAVSSQKCVRAGGKHNDLENVGYTARHHTFFEMLGNFSFGDYFKRDAIHFAWTFLTSPDWLALPKDKLWITVYANDDEAYAIWADEIGVPKERIIRIGDNKGAPYASDNFWTMGDTGPCGPCSEIFYDHGAEVAGGPPGSAEEDGDRYIEIWNLVFMQFNRSADGSMDPLPAPSVDTGMGLERISAVLQRVHSNYEIDLFQSLLNAAAKVIGCTQQGQASLKVVADHIRSCSFLIADGVLPSNEGRGYVLRRIIRRACRHGHKLGARGAFFYQLAFALAKEMGAAYPQLIDQQAHIERVLQAEEEQFSKTLEQGLKILEQDLADLKGTEIPGETVFKLYDTYGFPYDLTADIARERGLTLDEAGFEREMDAQRERARAASSFGVDYTRLLKVEGTTDFLGYQQNAASGQVIGLFVEGQPVEQLSEGQSAIVVLSQTPFYAESGGQVGDCGLLTGQGLRFEVRDCSKSASGAHLHHGVLTCGSLTLGQTVKAQIDSSLRQAIALNHSATHLLHAALREVLGAHVEQKGSRVESNRLRFDFSHFEAVSEAELAQIERRVNQQIRQNHAVTTEITDMQTAKQRGAQALFGEKYGEKVRLLSMGEFSVELCGGTHVSRTGDIGLFKIQSEGGIAAGIRRIEAVTGQAALDWVDSLQNQLKQLAAQLKTNPASLEGKLTALLEKQQALEKQQEQLSAQLVSHAGDALAAAAQVIGGIKLLAARVDGQDGKALALLAEQLKNKLGSAVILLGGELSGKVVLVCAVTADLTTRIKAGDLLKQAAALIGGKGGGRPELAQGGGTDVSKLDQALALAAPFVQERL